MLDIKKIFERTKYFQERLRTRDQSIDLSELVLLYEQKKAKTPILDSYRRERKELSKEIGELKKDGQDCSHQISKVNELKLKTRKEEDSISNLDFRITEILSTLPNIPHKSVPVSYNEEDKKVIYEGNIEGISIHRSKDHLELGKNLGILSMEKGSKISGTGFPVYIGKGAELEMAILNFLLDHARSKGYTQVILPVLVDEKTAFVAGNLPKFRDQLYRIESDNLFLIPTSEMPLASLHRDEVLDADQLPLYYACLTPNFRREAGSAGKRDKGLIRTHQFNKVELFKYVHPEKSYEEFDLLVKDVRMLVEMFGIPYRVTLLPTCDLAQQASKTIDVEIWIPSQKKFYEVSSCSNCEDYQTRRGNTKFRDSNRKLQYIHTLNGSGLATSRLFVSILENYQDADGNVAIPEVLIPYTRFEKLTAKEI